MQACSKAADVDMDTLQPSTYKSIDGLMETDRNLDQAGRAVELVDSKDEEMVSDRELEELHEFMLTQRNSGPQVAKSGRVEEDLSSNVEGSSESESEDEDMVDLSQALLRKLEESFVHESMQDEHLMSSSSTTENEIRDKLNDSSVSAHTTDSDHVMLAAVDSNDVELNNVDSSSAAVKLPSCEDYQKDRKLEESSAIENDEDNEVGNQLTPDCLRQSGEICAELKESEMTVSADNWDRVEVNVVNDDLVAESGKNVESESNINGLVTKLPQSAGAEQDEMCSYDVAGDQPSSSHLAVDSTYHSAASPPSLFEESSIDQCDLERLNSNSNISVSSENQRQTSDSEFINIDQLIGRCESPDDLFDSPSSCNSVASPAASPQAESNPSQQVGPSLPEPQIHSDTAKHGCQTPPSLCKAASSLQENLRHGISQEQGGESSLLAPKTTQYAGDSLETGLEVFTKPGSQPTTAAPDGEPVEIVELEKCSGDEADVSELRQADSGEETARRCSLRKVRAKTRNSFTSSSDAVNVSRVSSGERAGVSRTPNRRNGRSSREVYSDVEPDSDGDDKADNPSAVSDKAGCGSRGPSRSNSSSSTQSTVECYVRLTRVSTALLPPQVEQIQFVIIFILPILKKFKSYFTKLNLDKTIGLNAFIVTRRGHGQILGPYLFASSSCIVFICFHPILQRVGDFGKACSLAVPCCQYTFTKDNKNFCLAAAKYRLILTL